MPFRPLLVPPGYADLIRNTPGLVAYWRMRDSSGTVMRNELTTAGATMQGTPTLRQGTPIADGAGIKFDGSSQALYAAVNLSPYAQVSLSWWMWWDAWANNDKLAFEYGGANYLNNGFMIDVNATSGYMQILFGTSTLVWADNYARPSAAAWHHWVVTFDRGTTKALALCLDGALQSPTATGHGAGTYGNFSNSTLNFMSRNHAALWGAGRMAEVALFGGVILTANDARKQYRTGVGQ